MTSIIFHIAFSGIFGVTFIIFYRAFSGIPDITHLTYHPTTHFKTHSRFIYKKSYNPPNLPTHNLPTTPHNPPTTYPQPPTTHPQPTHNPLQPKTPHNPPQPPTTYPPTTHNPPQPGHPKLTQTPFYKPLHTSSLFLIGYTSSLQH